MTVWEILVIGVALSMDAFAVSMTNGMSEPNMSVWKTLAIAGAYALFQFFMPIVGYFCGAVFAELVAKIAPWLSFALLAFIGGKMIFDCSKELLKARGENSFCKIAVPKKRKLGAGQLLLQAVATSLDALAVGVTLIAAETTSGLPAHVALCTLLIGATTLTLSAAALFIGKKAGDKFSDRAELLGGMILVVIGIKIILDGIL